MAIRHETAQLDSEARDALACCHHWIIETANGPISRGVCQICLESREFKNSIFDTDRDYQDGLSREESVVKASVGAVEE